MRSWSISQARSQISELFEAALTTGPQIIERRDRESVVMLSQADWRRLVTEYPTVADLILDFPAQDSDLPERRPARVVSRDL
jgi:prevent-host-death family protein